MRGFNTGRGRWEDDAGLARDVGAAAGGAAQAAGSVAAANTQASAIRDAANTAAQSANRSADLVQGRYDTTRADLDPYQQTGQAAASEIDADLPSWGAADPSYLNAASNLYGQQQADTNIAGDLYAKAMQIGQGPGGEAALEQTPGYQFTRDQGLQSVQNSAAARGLGVSGAALKGAATYATGLADQTYQQQYSDAVQNAGNFLTLGASYGAQGGQQLASNSASQGNLTNAYNRLMGSAGLGENAAAQTGSTGSALANTAAGAITSGGAAVAASQVAGGNAAASGINGVGNAYNQYNSNQLLKGLIGQQQSSNLAGGGSYGYDPSSYGYSGDAQSPGASSLQSLGFYNPLS